MHHPARGGFTMDIAAAGPLTPDFSAGITPTSTNGHITSPGFDAPSIKTEGLNGVNGDHDATPRSAKPKQ